MQRNINIWICDSLIDTLIIFQQNVLLLLLLLLVVVFLVINISSTLLLLLTTLRYIVCRGLKPGSEPVKDYMFRVNLKLNQLRDSERDVTDLVPLSIIKEDTDFYQFMVNSNERWGSTTFRQDLMVTSLNWRTDRKWILSLSLQPLRCPDQGLGQDPRFCRWLVRNHSVLSTPA